MTLYFTFSDGKTIEIKGVKIGDQQKVEYTDKEGQKIIKYINTTSNMKLVMS